MRHKFASYWAASTLIVSLVNSLPAVAEETGHWHGLGGLVAIDKKAVNLEDRPNHTAGITEFDGIVFNVDSKPFLDKARYQVVSLNDTGVATAGYKTFTDADGAKVFCKYATTGGKWPDFHGTFEFTGGTGKYQGITGNGTYHIVFVSDKASWDELVGDYKMPTPLAQSSTTGK